MKTEFVLLGIAQARFGYNPGAYSYRPGEADYPLFDYSGLESQLSGQQQTWKYTEPASTASTPTTKDWHQFVNNQGITNWEDHLRSQGIDPQENAAKGLNADGSAKEEWYNPFLECKQGLAFNGDTAPLVGIKTKYLATPGWPTKTMGVFECKWTIKRDPSVKYVKLTFNVIEFQCNGLDPTVKSWGTANHIKIWDGKKTKTIDCGKKRQPPYYSTSDEIQVQLQINTAGYGIDGGRIKIMYQSVRQKGTPILKPTPGPQMKTILPRHNGRIQNPQEPAVLNDPNHIQNPRRGTPLNKAVQQRAQQRPQVTNQRPQQSHQQPVHYVQQLNQQPNHQPNPYTINPPPGLDLIQLKQAGIDYKIVLEDGSILNLEQPGQSGMMESTTTSTTLAEPKPKSKSGLVSVVFGIIAMVLILLLLWFAWRKCKEKISESTISEKPVESGKKNADVVQFVNDLVSGKVPERDTNGTATTVTTTGATTQEREKKVPPPRPHLPYSKVKIASLEPHKAEVSKWDD